jgi:hypothetical protein
MDGSGAAELPKAGPNFHPPWIGRLFRAEREISSHPNSISSLSAYPMQGQYDQLYKGLMQSSANAIRTRWRKNWRRVLAVGPFVKRNRRLDAIPFVLCGDIRSFGANLDALSKALADTYVEFGILPSVFILNEAYVESLEQHDNRNWNLTSRFSVHIGEPHERA